MCTQCEWGRGCFKFRVNTKLDVRYQEIADALGMNPRELLELEGAVAK